LLSGIGIGSQADLGHKTWALTRHLAKPLHASSDRPAISFNSVLANEPHEFCTRPLGRMQRIHIRSGNDTSHQPFDGNMIHASDVDRIPRSAWEIKGQVARLAIAAKTVGDA